MSNHPILFIIDDDPDDQEILMEALYEIDPSIKCFTAMNGQDGLQMLDKKHFPFPSLIFLDLNMPRINGQRFLFEIKQNDQYKSVPVIIYTTSGSQKDMDETKLLGALEFMIKPANFFDLKDRLLIMLSNILPEQFNRGMVH